MNFSSEISPLERYKDLTDLPALRDFSARPLRKSLRVNTLKSSVEAFQVWAKDHSWQLEPVAWCPEGFFIDRADRSTPLGKDLLHLLGHVYLQEAASMLPVALLDLQPGERILDMSAAPGSKASQIAAQMQNSGVVVANDVQEKRLGTLKTALHRLGVTNFLLTKKQGQWFGREMAECFDRVLVDAPCTAQGTARKDPDALKYGGEENIRTMSKIQKQLLESAVHAATVGGRIVYSTCTLTPEENEEVCLWILNKFSDQISALSPAGNSEFRIQNLPCAKAVEDARIVLRYLQKNNSALSMTDFECIRLWPQTYDTEGFFCAVFEKTASTCESKRIKAEHFQERPLKKRKTQEIGSNIALRYGTDFLCEGDCLFQRDDQLLLGTQNVADFALPIVNYSLGLPFGKLLKDGSVRLAHDLVTLRGGMASENVMDLSAEELDLVLKGRDIPCEENLTGDTILTYRGLGLGLGLGQSGMLKNRLSRWMVSYFA